MAVNAVVVVDGIRLEVEAVSIYQIDAEVGKLLEKRKAVGLYVPPEGITIDEIKKDIDSQTKVQRDKPTMRTDAQRLFGIMEDEQPTTLVFSSKEFLEKKNKDAKPAAGAGVGASRISHMPGVDEDSSEWGGMQ